MWHTKLFADFSAHYKTLLCMNSLLFLLLLAFVVETKHSSKALSEPSLLLRFALQYRYPSVTNFVIKKSWNQFLNFNSSFLLGAALRNEMFVTVK